MKKLIKVLVLFILIISFVLPVTTYAYFVGSARSNIYHYPNCEWAQRISYSNLIKFDSVSQAHSRGYRSCRVCYPPNRDEYVYKLVLDSPPQNMHVGDVLGFKWRYWPAGAIDANITINSSDPNVAYIQDGQVYAKSIGKTKITASTPNKVTYSYILNVIPIYAESIVIEEKPSNLNIPEGVKLSATVLPFNTTDKTIVWKSTNPKVATISDDGYVSAISDGYCEIVASCNKKSDRFKLTVHKVPVSDIIINNLKDSFYLNEEYIFDCSIEPSNASIKTIEYQSSNPEIISIDNNGKLEVKQAGDCTIYIKCDNVKKEINISSYYVKTEGIKVSNIYFLYPKMQKDVTISILPENASNKNYVATISNENIAAINGNVLTGIAFGFTNLTVTSADGTETTKLVYVHNIYVDILLATILLTLVVIILNKRYRIRRTLAWKEHI